MYVVEFSFVRFALSNVTHVTTFPMYCYRLLNSPLVDDISKHAIHLNNSAHSHPKPPAPTSILASIHHPLVHPATPTTTAVASTSSTAVNNNTARASTSVIQGETAATSSKFTSASQSNPSVPRKSVSIVLPLLQDIKK